MIRGMAQGSVWIVMVWSMVVLAACGGMMADSSGQNGGSAHNSANNPDAPTGPDAPVSGVPGQSGGGSRGSMVTGRVVDPAGQPVVGAMVMPQSKDTPPQPIPEIAVMTNADGRYQWSLPPGRYTFTVHHERYAPTTSDSVTVTHDQVTTLDITAQKQ